jgi:hypothetical protein
MVPKSLSTPVDCFPSRVDSKNNLIVSSLVRRNYKQAHLFSQETLWTRRHRHELQPHANRTSAHEDDFVPCYAQAHDGFYDDRECG